MRGKRVHAVDCEVTVRLLNAPSVACPSASGDDSAVDAAKTRPFTLSMSTNENFASTLSSRSFIFRPMARAFGSACARHASVNASPTSRALSGSAAFCLHLQPGLLSHRKQIRFHFLSNFARDSFIDPSPIGIKIPQGWVFMVLAQVSTKQLHPFIQFFVMCSPLRL